jgi:hypothetical protein
MAVERHTDNDPLDTGTQSGPAGLSIYSRGADFLSCGVTAGLAVENETSGETGLVVSVSEDAVTCTITFLTGDTYNIYKTAEKDSAISSIHTDRMYGRKIFKRSEVNERGHSPKDEDLDADRDHVFGPLQPERPRRY